MELHLCPVATEARAMWLWLSKPFWDPLGVGEFTTNFRTYFSGDWEVHWGTGTDPRPSLGTLANGAEMKLQKTTMSSSGWLIGRRASQCVLYRFLLGRWHFA